MNADDDDYDPDRAFRELTRLRGDQTRSQFLAQFLSPFLLIYMWLGGVLTLYFNWKYAQDHGFASWLMFGEIIATAKGLVWPYFLFFK